MKKIYVLIIATLFTINIAKAQWVTLATGTTKFLNSISFPDNNTGYIVGGEYINENIVLKTTNGGATWDSIYTEDSNLLNAVYFTSVDTGYVVGIMGTILKTTDGGISWTSQTFYPFFDLNSIYFINHNHKYSLS